MYNEETMLVIEDYLNECRACGLTEKTIIEYKFRLKYVAKYIYNNLENKSLLDLRYKDFRNMILNFRNIKDKNNVPISNSRINSVLSTLINCLNYVEDDEDTFKDYDKNYCRKLKRLPTLLKKERVYMNRSEVKKIIDTCLANWDIQGAVLASILYDSGARIGEVAQITKSSDHNWTLNSTNKVKRKGKKKEDKLIVMSDTLKLIKTYLNLRGEDNINELFIYPKIPNPKKKRGVATEAMLRKRVYEWRKIVGKEITPHTFRRTRAQTLIDGEDERFNSEKTFTEVDAQHILGHSNLSTTTNNYLRDKKENTINDIMQSIV